MNDVIHKQIYIEYYFHLEVWKNINFNKGIYIIVLNLRGDTHVL